MSDIPALLVKQLRDKTGVSFMRCKKALAATGADVDKAVVWLREQGEGVAASKSSRAAAEGSLIWRVADGAATLLEVNCETDSVSRLEDFNNFCAKLAEAITREKPANLEALMAVEVDGQNFEKTRQELVGRIGENIQVRRFLLFTDSTSRYHAYIHGGRLAAVVALNIDDESLGHDMAMQVVASQTDYISIAEIPAEMREKERAIIAAGLVDSKKPEEIKARIVEGKLNKQLGALALEEQAFIKDPQMVVKDVLAKHQAKIDEMHLWRCGEGIDKPQDNFVDEVKKQAATVKSA
ncbi:MAG: translation elongation factor Ts [Proteobacteria bacterium]|nr:translation elongation factor Ts [Pseudomonadota bacterium]